MSNVTLWTRPSWNTQRFARDFFGPATANDWFKQIADIQPVAEVAKDGDDAVVRLDLPGLSPEAVANDVHVELDRSRLVVHGERRDERSEDKDGRTFSEVRYGSFRRSFAVPAHVTSDAVSASYDAGVLTVRVAGAYAGTEPQRIAISQ